MPAVITPIAESHFEGLYRALDAIAREGQYLAFTRAPPKGDAYSFYREIVARDYCHLVALRENAVVGWCDILPTHGQARAHVGTLGIGVVPPARRDGIGTQLMEAALANAERRGLTRIELTVRTDNQAARTLYARFGFQVEGVGRHAFCVDGRFFDSYFMARVRQTGRRQPLTGPTGGGA